MITTPAKRADALTEPQQLLLGRLILAPTPSLNAGAIAALAGTGEEETQAQLHALLDAGLIECRYSLTAAQAELSQNIGNQNDPFPERRAAIGRLVDWYLQRAAAAQHALNPDRWYLGRYLQDEPKARFSQPEALAWLTSEQRTISELQRLASGLALHTPVWELAEAMTAYHHRRKLHPLAAAMYERGLTAAEHLGHEPAQAVMHIGIAQARLGQGAYGTASAVAEKAGQIARQATHRLAEASALDQLGAIALAADRLDDAQAAFTGARQIHIDLERPRGIALMNRHLGEVALAGGDPQRAKNIFIEALDFFINVEPDLYQRARCLLLIGMTDTELDEPRAAEQSLHAALRAAEECAAPHEKANVMACLADLAESQGDHALAQQFRHDTQALYAGLNPTMTTDAITGTVTDDLTGEVSGGVAGGQ